MREVVVGPAVALESDGVEVDGVNWLSDPPTPAQAVSVQLRHRAPAVAHPWWSRPFRTTCCGWGSTARNAPSGPVSPR